MQIQYADEEAQSLLSQPIENPYILAKDSPVVPQPNQPKLQSETSTPGQLPHQYVHKVQYGDTLEGLSLEYSVPIGKIKYRNHIDGDNIYHLKEIIIPNPQCLPQDKEKTEDLLIEEFVSHMNYSEKEKKVARYYLTEADWKIEQALKEYRQDLQWEQKNKAKISSVPLKAQTDYEMKEIKRFYDRAELMNKKKS